MLIHRRAGYSSERKWHDVYIQLSNWCRQLGVELSINHDQHPLLTVTASRHFSQIAINNAINNSAVECDHNHDSHSGLIGISCHDQQQLDQANSIKADYALLSPVLPTQTHSEVRPLGWQKFSELVASSDIPVYALGGLSIESLPQARLHGAHGIAGISLVAELLS